MGRLKPLPETASLLPHEGSARLIEEVLDVGDREIVCRGTISPDSPYVAKGRAPAFTALELAAQAAAVLEAIGRIKTGSEVARRIGYLVSGRDLVLSCADFPAGAPLVASATLYGEAPPLSIYRVAVTLDHQRILAGLISTYIDPA